jgi:ribosomal protein S18 acetylase RimI-like enzyme
VDVNVRVGVASDLDRVVALHAQRIGEGFLPTLGRPFLHRLYRRVIRSRDAFVVVADRAPHHGGPAFGFVAGAADLGALYRRFVVRDGVQAGLVAAPRLARSVPRVRETLRYPDETGDLPAAEILAVAVDDLVTGEGIGGALMEGACRRFRMLGVTSAKVVTAAGNTAALRMYEAAGFVRHSRIEVHAGAESEVLVWNSPSD